jgi:hypothetical protein
MEFKNPQEELERFRSRLAFAGGFVLFCFSLLFIRFVWLQVVQHDYYQTRAEDNRISLVPIVPNRGLIVDRKGEVLARNYSAYTLEITPSRAGNLDKTIDGLAEIIEIEAKDRRRFKKLMDESKSFETLPIRTRLTDEEVAKFIAHRYRFPGVEIKARLFRQYPGGAFASHILGYIGRITDADLGEIEKVEQDANYRGTEHFGKTGLEQRYEFELHGISGHEQVEVDAGGRAVRTLSRSAPVAGNQLTLTVDAELQRIAELAFGDRKGALVAIEPPPAASWPWSRCPTTTPTCSSTASTRRAGANSTSRRQADGQPRAQRRLSAGFDLQALHGAGRAGTGQAHARSRRSPTRASSTSAATTSATTRRAATAWWTCTSRSCIPATPTTTCWPTTWASTTSPLHGPAGLGQRTGIDIEGESEGRAAVAGVEESASRSRSSRSGMPAKPSRSASARATTPTRRSSWRRRRRPWPTTA